VGKELVRLDGFYKSFPLHSGILEEIRFENRRLTRKRQSVNVINGVDLSVRCGEALCVVGESGCGKSTVAGLIMGLLRPTAGSVHYEGPAPLREVMLGLVASTSRTTNDSVQLTKTLTVQSKVATVLDV
jgi:ABC-type oligopeptide transport system ATPase subunit